MLNKKFNKDLTIFSIFIIPLLTIYFGIRKSPFKYTLSMIGNWFDLEYRLRFIIWGIVTSIILTIFIIQIYKKTQFKNKKAFRYLYASGVLLVLTVITPTITKEIVPFELRTVHISMHAIYGLFFAITLIFSLYLFSKYLSEINKELSTKAIRGLILTVGVPFLTLIIFGMTGLFEILFFIAITLFLWIIQKDIHLHLSNNNKTNPLNYP
ncbi:MAG: hypothetical protein PF542_01255 [Nanoarchaeota archaeon]|nr:hypothetical protein [Nanoarchaeota archaeon]